jgi:hypothetical protein
MRTKCSKKCGRDAKPGQKYCRECHAAYMREFRKSNLARKLDKAFLAGFSALRADLIESFKQIGKGEMNGYTGMEIVKNARPDVPRATISR